MLKAWQSFLSVAWRSIASRPAFSLLVIACLALGIAVNTTVFAVFDAILWRPYDFAQPERLAVLRLANPRNGDDAGLAMAAFHDIRRESRSYTAVAGVVSRSMTITNPTRPAPKPEKTRRCVSVSL